uniref:Uncharacterized protein n=1 Tax=Trichogramma kaykai TaxID=54128 RepID=A0ABD2WS99_9HYME
MIFHHAVNLIKIVFRKNIKEIIKIGLCFHECLGGSRGLPVRKCVLSSPLKAHKLQTTKRPDVSKTDGAYAVADCGVGGRQPGGAPETAIFCDDCYYSENFSRYSCYSKLLDKLI